MSLPFAGPAMILVIALAPAFCAHAGGVYWTDRGASQLKRMDFDGSNLQTIQLSGAVSSPGSNIRGIAFDAQNSRIYWADNGADRLLRATATGSASTILTTLIGGNSFPADVRLDLANGFLYWCDQTRNRIQRSTLEGASVSDIITNAAPTGPYFMDIDVAAGKLYWGDFGGGAIYRANLDGTARQTLLTGNNNTRGVRLDPREGMLYWINRDDKKVHRCPLAAMEGGAIPLTHPAIQTLYTNLDTPHGLTLDLAARKVYWADTGTNPGEGTGGQAICRGDFDGGTPLEIIATGTEPWDVDLDTRSTNYVDWMKRCFRRDAPATLTAPDADPDNDGLPNAAEYAFDLSPLFAERRGVPVGLLMTDPTEDALFDAIRYRRRSGTTDLQFAVQVSTDLIHWAGDGPTPVTMEVQATALGDDIAEVTVRSLEPISGQASRFLRVRITYSPQTP